MFYDRFKQLCNNKGVTPSHASVEIGFSKGSISYWKKKYQEGVNAKPDSYTAAKIADYFDVSVDYLLERTNNPVDYDASGTIFTEIPSYYVELANGDMKKAREIMLASNRDIAEKQRYGGLLDKFSREDASLICALWGDDADGIDDKDLADIRQFAAFIKNRKSHN